MFIRWLYITSIHTTVVFHLSISNQPGVPMWHPINITIATISANGRLVISRHVLKIHATIDDGNLSFSIVASKLPIYSRHSCSSYRGRSNSSFSSFHCTPLHLLLVAMDVKLTWEKNKTKQWWGVKKSRVWEVDQMSELQQLKVEGRGVGSRSTCHWHGN